MNARDFCIWLDGVLHAVDGDFAALTTQQQRRISKELQITTRAESGGSIWFEQEPLDWNALRALRKASDGQGLY